MELTTNEAEIMRMLFMEYGKACHEHSGDESMKLED